ncbi:F-box/kelch-repeat protein At3g23880-like [Rutidosis leptorrhynchoides]|uniref:F-box/kelch-repeat protein At3g23880-like n=1 Tax=Rutidosis leptorrhynchoides TaxID=125765 RepID=UPI003A993CE7
MTLEDGHHQQQPKMIEKAESLEASEEIHSVPRLMSEITVEILMRLPVESLLRCKSVCKLWCSLISDPHFINSHLKLSSNCNNYANHILVFRTVPINLKSCNLNDVLYGKSIYVLELDYPLKHPDKSVSSEPDYPLKYRNNPVSIVGSCNGLLCILVDDETLFIWNPSTRRSNRLPYCNFETGAGWYMSYGFGYDTLTDDYKVVVMFQFETGYTEVKIYSLRRGNWKTLSDFPQLNVFGDDGKFLNGAIHWFVSRDLGPSYSWTIVSVGLGNESYGEVPQPVYDEGDKYLTLGVLGEKLCVVCDFRGKCADVWVMKVYGDQDSWTKLVSVPHLTDPDGYYMPLLVSNDGKVLLKCWPKLVVYDSKNSLLFEIQKFDKFCEAYTFVESLVSPDSPIKPRIQL